MSKTWQDCRDEAIDGPPMKPLPEKQEAGKQKPQVFSPPDYGDNPAPRDYAQYSMAGGNVSHDF